MYTIKTFEAFVHNQPAFQATAVLKFVKKVWLLYSASSFRYILIG